METEISGKTINIGIKEIRQKYFLIEESKEINEESIQYNIETNTQITIEKDEMSVLMGATFIDNEEVFLAIKVMTTFYIENLSHFVDDAKQDEIVNLPEKIWIIVMGLSYSHTRAMLAQQTNGTKYQHFILPIVEPQTLLTT